MDAPSLATPVQSTSARQTPPEEVGALHALVRHDESELGERDAHIVDRDHGGRDELSNLRALCSTCNQGAKNHAREPPRSLRRRTLLQTFGGLRYPDLGPDVLDFCCPGNRRKITGLV